jgi:hypothetical protein
MRKTFTLLEEIVSNNNLLSLLLLSQKDYGFFGQVDRDYYFTSSTTLTDWLTNNNQLDSALYALMSILRPSVRRSHRIPVCLYYPGFFIKVDPLLYGFTTHSILFPAPHTQQHTIPMTTMMRYLDSLTTN